MIVCLRRAEVGSESGDEGRAQLLGRVASLEGELSRLKEELAQLLDDREEDENMIHRLQVENEELERALRHLESGKLHKSGAAEDQEEANGDTRCEQGYLIKTFHLCFFLCL